MLSVLALALGASLWAGGAPVEQGRFQLVAGCVDGRQMILKIDTATGKTWKFQRKTRLIEPPSVQRLREAVRTVRLAKIPPLDQFTLVEAVHFLTKAAREAGALGKGINVVIHVPPIGLNMPPEPSGLRMIDPLTGKPIRTPNLPIDPDTGLPIQGQNLAPLTAPINPATGVPRRGASPGAKKSPRFDPAKTLVRGLVAELKDVTLEQILRLVARSSEVPLAIHYEEHAVVLAPLYSNYYRSVTVRREVSEGWTEVGELSAPEKSDK